MFVFHRLADLGPDGEDDAGPDRFRKSCWIWSSTADFGAGFDDVSDGLGVVAASEGAALECAADALLLLLGPAADDGVSAGPAGVEYHASLGASSVFDGASVRARNVVRNRQFIALKKGKNKTAGQYLYDALKYSGISKIHLLCIHLK